MVSQPESLRTMRPAFLPVGSQWSSMWTWRVGAGGVGRRGCVDAQDDVEVRVEEAGEVAEGFSEELAAAPLRAQQTSDGEPA